MLKAVNAALIALNLICASKADAQEHPAPDAPDGREGIQLEDVTMGCAGRTHQDVLDFADRYRQAPGRARAEYAA